MARIALYNPVEIDREVLGSIAEAAGLPAGRVCLIVGDPRLDGDLQGITLPREFVPIAGNLYGLGEHLLESWDCGVVIGEVWAGRQAAYPAYFAYLLGHEFGHATTVLSNLGLAVYEDLIFRFIKAASGGEICRNDQLPHEIRYDQFGIAVAQELYGRAAFEADCQRILSSDIDTDKFRLEKVLGLTPTTDLDGLPEELAAFSSPYRDKLLSLWEQARERGHLKIANGLSSLDALWSAT